MENKKSRFFYYGENDRVQEIGMIEDLNICPEESREIILCTNSIKL
ncbi:MAG: hypothetical protein NC824_04395 [Candidatus Omnitrophica bacterium]|nr:hypothetical protein [Candidatus Omnitrophota bacterium]